MLGAKDLIDSKNKTEARTFPFPPTGDTRGLRPFFPTVFPMVANSHKSRNFKVNKTRVGFGRTDLSFGAIGTTFCALSHGHGFKGPCFQGGFKSSDFHIFFKQFFDGSQ